MTTLQIEFKIVTGSWSKWGGGRKQLYENQFDRSEEDWICQSCAQKQPRTLTAYRYKFAEGEYLRVCATCFAEECPLLKVRMQQETILY